MTKNEGGAAPGGGGRAAARAAAADRAAAAAVQLEQLTQQYRRDALGRVLTLQQLVSALRSAAAAQAPALRAQARLLAHSMRGTAGTCGLPRLGAAAGRIEDALLSSAAEPADWHALDGALLTAREIAEQAAADANASPHESFTAVDAHLALAQRQAGPPRAVVLDDDAAFLDVVAALLASEGVELQQLRLADDLAAILDGPPPELLLLDVDLPGISAVDVCRVLRATAGWREVPVFFMSTDARTETRMASFRAGADDFIAKPVQSDELLAKLSVALERARLRRHLTERED